MAEPAESFVGMVLADRYELSSVLGQGQSGMVFKARHRQLDRFVALKLLMPESMADKSAFMRFEREAHSIGRLNHPNIVTVFDLGRWRNERPFLVMDYIEGQDLQDLVGKDGRLPIARAVRIAAQIASALSHAHKRGVIHRDLKPRNIMLLDAEDIMDFVKVVDFGIAKPFDVDQSEALTLEGYVVGTPLYMSPEQCSSGKVDARTDIYALGTLIYKMITGVNPISGKNLTEIMSNQINSQPLPFEEACQYVHIPRAIQSVIYKALAKDPEHRQSSMSELRKELNDAFEQEVSKRAGLEEEQHGTIVIGGMAKFSTEPKEEVGSHSKIIDKLREKAEAGDTAAQYDLVLRLEFGQGCKPNLAEASRWLRQAAQRGMSQAQWRLGDHLLRGEGGFGVSPVEAVQWLTKSAEQGYDAAQFSLGWCYEHGLGVQVDVRRALAYYQAAAKQGNAQAKDQLKVHLGHNEKTTGTYDISGFGAQERIPDDPEAIFAMGCKMRDSGQRAADKEKALKLFQRAASMGHDLAQMALVEMSLKEAARPDLQSEAMKWLEQASTQKNQRAKLLLSACLKSGIACAKNPPRALELINTLANDDRNVTAQAILGASMLTGDLAARNIPRGITLLRQAADAGDGLARWKLAICFRNGIGVPKDPRMLEQLFAQSAEESFPQGVEEFWKPASLGFNEAVQIFKSMSAAGNKNALLWLGICFENGLSSPRDLNAALKCYQDAQTKGLAGGQKAADRVKQLMEEARSLA
jgi:TPR repeat protein/tRNA A-37 threonylcarbamoyl transferase component Bud32